LCASPQYFLQSACARACVAFPAAQLPTPLKG